MKPKVVTGSHDRTHASPRFRAASVLAVLALAAPVRGQTFRNTEGVTPRTVATQRQALAGLRQRAGDTVEVRTRPAARTPRQIKGAILQPAVREGQSREERTLRTAQEFLNINRVLLGIKDPGRELVLTDRSAGLLARTHLRFSQAYQGIPVWPADLIVHLDVDGNVDLMDGAFVETPESVDTHPTLSAQNALDLGRAAASAGPGAAVDGPILIIYAPEQGAEPQLAWKMTFHIALDAEWLVVGEAHSGETLAAFNQVCTAAATGSGTDLWNQTRQLNVWEQDGTYYMIDTTKQMFDASSTPPDADNTRGAIVVLDAQNQSERDDGSIPNVHVTSNDPSTWSAPDAVSAMFGLSETYDYYLERHARNSLDGNGGTIIGIVRYGQNYENAFWNSQVMVFGDGSPYAGALDIVGHELTHGVTEHASDLAYQDQPGALNEALSDIFGEMVEARTNGRPDWLKGAELGGNPIQNYADPHAAEQMPGVPNPAAMSEYLQTTEDNGGVHINSSIINHCFYLLAAGMDGAIGIADAERIFYRANTVHLVQNSQFVDCRLACIQSAEEIYGADSQQVRAVAVAFDAVEILDDGSVPAPAPQPAPTPQPDPSPTPTPTPGGDDGFEDNDSPDQARPIALGAYQLQGNDDDWFIVEAGSKAMLTITVDGPTGDMDLYVFDSMGNELDAGLEDGSREFVQVHVPGGTAIIAVAPYQGLFGGYTLTVSAEQRPTPAPRPRPLPEPDPSPAPYPDPNPQPLPPNVDVFCGTTTPIPMMALAVSLVGLGSLNRRHRVVRPKEQTQLP